MTALKNVPQFKLVSCPCGCDNTPMRHGTSIRGKHFTRIEMRCSDCGYLMVIIAPHEVLDSFYVSASLSDS